METNLLKEKVKRWTILLGVLQILIGALTGLIPPSAVAWFRGLVMAHIEFIANGVLVIVFGLLVSELRLGAGALKTWFIALQLGTWSNGAAGVVAAFTGQSSMFMPSLNEKFPPPNGTESVWVTGLLLVCAAGILLSLFLTLFGLLRFKKN